MSTFPFSSIFLHSNLILSWGIPLNCHLSSESTAFCILKAHLQTHTRQWFITPLQTFIRSICMYPHKAVVHYTSADILKAHLQTHTRPVVHYTSAYPSVSVCTVGIPPIRYHYHVWTPKASVNGWICKVVVCVCRGHPTRAQKDDGLVYYKKKSTYVFRSYMQCIPMIRDCTKWWYVELYERPVGLKYY